MPNKDEITKIISDERIVELFDASWATHGDRVLRFARMIESEVLEKMNAEIERLSLVIVRLSGVKTTDNLTTSGERL